MIAPARVFSTVEAWPLGDGRGLRAGSADVDPFGRVHDQPPWAAVVEGLKVNFGRPIWATNPPLRNRWSPICAASSRPRRQSDRESPPAADATTIINRA